MEIQANSDDLIFGSRKTFKRLKDQLPNFSRIENEQLPANTLLGDISTVQHLLNMEGKYTYFEYRSELRFPKAYAQKFNVSR